MPDTIEYLVGPDSVVLEIHGNWDEFATLNAARDLTAQSVLGQRLSDFIAGPETRMIYEALVARILDTGESVRFTYRCDGPDCRRHMEMRVEPAAPEVVRFLSRLLREEPREVQHLLDDHARRSDEILTMCSWCKRVRDDAVDEWLDVEDYVVRTKLLEAAVLPQLSHGLCPHCEAEMDGLIASVA